MSVENLIKEALANLRNPATDSLSLVEQLLNQALAEPETDPRPQTQDSSKKQPGKFTKEIYDALTNGVGEKPYYRKEENQFNIYVADDQLICVVPFIEGPEGDYAEYIAKAICEAGLLIARLTAKQKFYISQWNQSDNARIKQAERIEELKKALSDCVIAQNTKSFPEIQCAANRARMLLEELKSPNLKRIPETDQSPTGD